MNQYEKEQKKRKIRKRYKGINTDALEVIPAKKQFDFYDNEVPRRVAVYVRVSTDNLQQTSSYELQKNYYESKVLRNKNWTLVDIYADEGISGTSLKHRDEFNRMISDCLSGKIDLIITKSTSRFSRNIEDSVSIIKKLAALENPVGVFFEAENIFTLNEQNEMSLNMMIVMAQEESHVKSSIMNASIEMRFSHGILLTPILLGYDHNEDGELIVNENEADTVRLIFFMYLFGYSCRKIADALSKTGRKTKKGNTVWSSGSILQILRNERYCGDVLTRKTYTPSYLDHLSKKNKGNRTQHRWRNHHNPIISRDDFIAVQHMIDNAKYGNKKFLPELKVISEGLLRGFVTINPRWAGFNANDYIKASEGVSCENTHNESDYKLSVNAGEFDYRGYEVAKAQFFSVSNIISATFSIKNIKFSSCCIHKLNDNLYVELYIHPKNYQFAVRTCNGENRNAVKWAKISNTGTIVSRTISGTAFLGTIYNLMKWNTLYKYRVRGVKKVISENESIFLFDMCESELYYPQTFFDNDSSSQNFNLLQPKIGKSVIALPNKWNNRFGNFYYVDLQTKKLLQNKSGKYINHITYCNMPDIRTTEQDLIEDSIKRVIGDLDDK